MAAIQAQEVDEAYTKNVAALCHRRSLALIPFLLPLLSYGVHNIGVFLRMYMYIAERKPKLADSVAGEGSR